ncbi:hypothetical protein RJ639_020667 [Escallonia herrerae]|uniref:Uncharacterized protein n=1 Tax=Escallonia herrerae TaxID=1293975 RepID=A0AA88V4R5_9ASTE|nr:hypothetical protein RJ639_020667 [Escallonia herrerae]
MEVNESSTSFRSSDHEHVQGTCKSFGEKCSHVAKKQRAKSSSSAAPAEVANGSAAVVPAVLFSEKRNSDPNPLDCCNVCANAWYLRMSASLTLLRAYFMDSSK